MRATARSGWIIIIGIAAAAASARSVRAQEEPGVAAVASARAALGRLAAAAAAPNSTTAALGPSLAVFAKPGEPARPVRGQAIDSAAQPFLAEVEPRLASLRSEILDRRYRFLTGEERPRPKRPELVTTVLDVRSILGSWGEERRPPSNAGDVLVADLGVDPPIAERTIHIAADKVRDLVDVELGPRDEGSVEISGGSLLVRGTAEEVARVEALLDRLRAATGRRLSLEVLAYRVSREVRLAQAAARTPEQAAHVLESAVAAGTATLLVSRSAVIEDGGVFFIAAGSSRSFLAQEEVNQTGVVPVVNPVVKRLGLGLRGMVRGMIVDDRGDVLVDLSLTYSELEKVRRETIGECELALPDAAVTRCATTVTLPLGQTALVGGTPSGHEDADTACVFAVKATRFQSRVLEARPRREAPVAPTELPAAAPRPEVADLDTLLAIVEDALAKVRSARRYELRIFDARDLLEGAHTRKAPALGFRPRLAEQSRGGGMTGGVLAFDDSEDRFEGPLALEPDKVEALVKSATGADAAWGDPAAYELHKGEILVRQTPGTLAAIERLLAGLRKDRIGNVEVSVDWCRLDDALLAELTRSGFALSREGVARLDSEVAGGERAARTAEAFVLALRGDVGVVHGGRESWYVSGFEGSSGGTGTVVSSVAVPILGFARTGLTLEGLGHGSLSGAENTLTLDARTGLGRTSELGTAHAPGGTVTTPTVESPEATFDGTAPAGALVLVVGRHPAEKRPAVVVVLRARVVGR